MLKLVKREGESREDMPLDVLDRLRSEVTESIDSGTGRKPISPVTASLVADELSQCRELIVALFEDNMGMVEALLCDHPNLQHLANQVLERQSA